MSRYTVIQSVFTRDQIIELLDEVDCKREGATEHEFPGRVGQDWYWFCFRGNSLVCIERYGFNDEDGLLTWAFNNRIIIAKY